MMFSYTTAVMLAVAVVTVNSLDAPPNVCFGMIPLQPFPAQASPPPYSITPAASQVKSGESVNVIIESMYPSTQINNIILQSRQGDKIVGKWTVEPGDSVTRLLNCGEPGNTVTQREHFADLDKQKVSYLWTAQTDVDGEVVFRATIQYKYGVYWVGVTSSPVKINKPAPTA